MATAAARLNNRLLQLDSRNYSEAAHRALIAEGIVEQYSTWFCCEFAPCDADLLVAGSSSGEIRLYSVTAMARAKQSASTPQPLMSLAAHKGACYGLAFAEVPGGDLLLFSCGDDGALRAWSWSGLMEAATSARKVDLAFEASVPLNGSQTPELNALCVDEGSGRIFGGAGDGMTYSWDIGTGSVADVLRGRKASGVLCASSHGATVATGSTDGIVRVWDTRSPSAPQIIKPEVPVSSTAPVSCWPVRCLRFDSGGNWLVSGAGRYLHPWSLAAGSQLGAISTEALPQTLVMEPNRMLVAGDEPALCRYDFSGHLVSKSITSLACAYGLARSHKTGVVAMAGCAGKLHVFGDGGSHLGGLR